MRDLLFEFKSFDVPPFVYDRAFDRARVEPSLRVADFGCTSGTGSVKNEDATLKSPYTDRFLESA